MPQYFTGKGGRAIYGVVLGIISNETVYPRVPGDSGNASTYPFPTVIRTVPQIPSMSIVERIVKREPTLLKEYVELIRELQGVGVRAITTTCGFNIVFQHELSKVSKVPVFTSSLLQLPLVQKILPRERKIGIITSNRKIFDAHRDVLLDCSGLDSSTPVVVEGLETKEGWLQPFLDQKVVEKEVVEVSKKMISENADIGAILFECHNLPPYAKAVQEATGLPVFDIMTLVDLMAGAVVKNRYVGIM
jgi:hypothetical protein